MAETLLLLPGLMCDARAFLPQIVSLGRDMPVMIAPISRGDRIEEIASEILSAAPARFALAGLSMGGIVALEILRRAPERVTRIALIATTPLAGTPQEASEREAWIVAAKSRRLDDAMAAELRPSYLANTPGRADVLARVASMWRTMGAETYVRQARALQRRKDQQATLRKIKQPALVLCGEADTLLPLKRHEFMAELIPYAQLHVIADAGHLPTLERPTATTEALRVWMKQPLVLR
tara:strand:+ start:566 stop:1276 length:711 start_codon:yes stop_codon:yes gene_type:complete